MKPEWQVTSCGSMLWSFARFTNDEVIGFRTPQLPFVKYEAFQTIFDDLLVILIGVRGGGLGGRPPPQAWKFSGQTLFFRATASSSKILNHKIYFSTVKNSRATLFFSASASCSKILNVKSISNTVKNSRVSLFSGQAQVTQNSRIIKNIFNTAKNFRALSVFQGKRKLLKNPE